MYIICRLCQSGDGVASLKVKLVEASTINRERWILDLIRPSLLNLSHVSGISLSLLASRLYCLLWHLIVSCGISLSLVASHCLLWHLIVSCGISLSLVASHCLLWHLTVSCGISLSLVASHCLLWHLIVSCGISLSLNFDWCSSNEIPAVNAHAVFLCRSLTSGGLCKLLGELFFWVVFVEQHFFLTDLFPDFST